jgi:hypothetical protein
MSLAYVHTIAALADEKSVVAEAPLVATRNRLGLKRGTVLAELRQALGLTQRDDSKLSHYYHRLESGRLEPTRVSDRLWSALDGILQWRGDPTHDRPLAATATAFTRMADASTPPDSGAAADLGFSDEAEPLQWDEVGELFLGPRTI